jgi:hypothetical protein
LDAYNQLLEQFLTETNIHIPQDFIVNARRFLYYQLYVSSLPFNDFLQEDGVWKGYVTLRDFPLTQLSPENSQTIRVISEGILQGKAFEMPL